MSGTISEDTYEHSYTSDSPLKPLKIASPIRAAAYAMDKVAEPPPALASTTSVPAFWMRMVKSSVSFSLNDVCGNVCDNNGKMVIPA
ncbi:unnamed protein product [Bathycoccus prasinos]